MTFKKYVWTIGNTTFRESNLNLKIEIQLNALKELFLQYPDEQWAPNLQNKYYDLLSTKSIDGKPFIRGTAPNKAKDARQLTSALADLGLVDRDSRKLTEIGNKILSIRELEAGQNDEFFEIDKDSFVYLKQLLKTQIYEDDIKIKPFLAFLYLVTKHEYLSRQEFTYLLPTCLNVSDVIDTSETIVQLRNGEVSIDSIIANKISSMSNYNEALELLLSSPDVSEDTITAIGFNRKSTLYDKPIFPVYQCLFDMFRNKDIDSVEVKISKAKRLHLMLKKINSNQQVSWRKYLKVNNRKINSDSITRIYENELFSSSTDNAFKEKFFYAWHTMKWESTLEDYFDLNRRYFLLTDIIKYNQEQFSLTTLASAFFEDLVDDLLEEPLLNQDEYIIKYLKDISLVDINPVLDKSKNDVYRSVQIKLGIDPEITDIELFLKNKRNQEFNELIDLKFPEEVLLELMDSFIDRNDERIKELVTDDATPSTCFEYIIGIIWYKQSGRIGFIEDFLKLSLDANYLPKSHAIGGNADLVFTYEGTDTYPNHNMLLEVTLSERDSQRQMEWEPVTRHLESQLLKSRNVNDYCVFVASVLSKKTMQTFRLQKDYEIDGFEEARIKIITLDGRDIKQIILNNRDYASLYSIFENAFLSPRISNEWYQKDIVTIL